LRLICIMLKYKPWRTSLLRTWKQYASKRKSGRQSVSSRASMLLQALCKLCVDMDGRLDVRVWGANLGRGVSRAAGPLAFLNRLGVLKEPDKSGSTLMLGGGEELRAKRVCQGVWERKYAVGKLRRWVRLADALGDPVAVKTCQEWVQVHQECLAKFQEAGVLLGKDMYVKNWLIRAWLLAGMHRGNVRRLGGTETINTRTFAKAFPDSKKWISMLVRNGCNGNLKDFMAHLEYDGPAELLTMHLCILLTRDMWKPAAWYAANAKELQRVMRTKSGCSGLHTLPINCVLDVDR